MNKVAVKHLSKRLIIVLDQGIDLIKGLNESDFTYRFEGESGTIGAHFRHILDFVFNFLAGCETGRIDYNDRKRETDLEVDRAAAVAAIENAVAGCKRLRLIDLEKKIDFHLEAGNYPDRDHAWCETSPARELEFVQSHALHHYALIALKLSRLGISVPEDFGVAPSTLDHWKKTRNHSIAAA